jgi:hypothetical protein
MGELTRWKPRQVFCTEQADHQDAPGELHVVKYRQGKVGTCALISEVLCGQLLTLAGIPTVEGRFVFASSDYAARHKAIPGIPYLVEPGWHFGSPFITGHPGPPKKLALLASPQEVVNLWVSDTWLFFFGGKTTTAKAIESSSFRTSLTSPCSATVTRYSVTDGEQWNAF